MDTAKSQNEMKRPLRATFAIALARLGAMAGDSVVVAAACMAAFALRLDFNEPAFGWSAMWHSCVSVCVVHILALIAFGCYRSSWRSVKWKDLPRFLSATALSCAILLALRIAMPNPAFAHLRPPYSITAIVFFLATPALVVARLAWKVYWTGRRREAELIERAELRFDNSAAARFLVGKTVLVTGAGGSIGSEIVRQVAGAGAGRIIMVERCENALYEIDREMRGKGFQDRIVPIMADAGNARRMEGVFEKFAPEVVLHAAACKHVPMVELNPEEGFLNNVTVTRTLAEICRRRGVRRFVLISTDKAVNPVSEMGKTKREAEKAVMALNSEPEMTAEGATGFCAVRFGNVFGSSGSVVPLFREQIAKGGPVTVTHPEMRRYFMTVQEAVSLVLQAASRRENAIFTLAMGESVRITDLAEGMIRQAGYLPYVDIPIVFTGIRPGEKLFEELDVSEKSCYRTDMAKIYITKALA